MNEGENTGMPTSPDFSSPNTSPDNSTPAQPSELPEQPAVAPEPAPAAPVTSLPTEEDAQPAQPISSGASTRPRFGFSRKFKAQQPAQAPAQQPVFGNAPEYFNNAVQDIVIADVAAADAKKKRKKIALIALIVVAVLAAGLGIFLLIVQLSKPTVGSVKSAFNRYANYVLYGEEKDSDFGEYSDTAKYTILDKYDNVDENYNKRMKELFEKFYSQYNGAVEQGIYKKDEAIDDYKEIVMSVYYGFEMDESISLNSIASSVISKGKEGYLKEISEKSKWYTEQGVSYLAEDWNNVMSAYASLAEAYNNAGCIVNGKIDYGCADGLADDSVVAAQKAFNDNKEAYRSVLASKKFVVYWQLWEVKELL